MAQQETNFNSTTATSAVATESNANETEKKQSFDDVLTNKTYQAEFDKRVSKAIDTAKEKWNEEFNEKLNSKLEEAGKLAKMTAEEKIKFEREKQEKEYNERIAAVTKRELKADAKEQFAEKGLPSELAEALNYSDAESYKKSMEAVEKAFSLAVENAVNNRLKGEVPKTGANTPNFDEMSDEEYYKKILKK